ncbi:hypothetical protein RRG08_045908 [Elysia crispata]|uniref:Uncharacterized protein n=1 Tax=Elysia crispata TaxID=231223 RepID=A0AAE1AR74_9GAST|nr:hypothetical protein RRG08_045908 [Elysia crispata]
MEKLGLFAINFTNTAGVFYAGQLVLGYVAGELNKPMKMRCGPGYNGIFLTQPSSKPEVERIAAQFCGHGSR